MTIRLHHNKSNGIFTARTADRAILAATGKRSVYRKLPLVGNIIPVGANVFGLVTVGLYREAQKGKRPMIPVVYTKFPRVRLCIMRLKEMIK